MRPAARVQAAIEVLGAVIDSAAGSGAAADVLIRRYFATRRYAGARDRAAVRELVYQAVRFTADRPVSGRAAMLGVAQSDPDLLALFDGSTHAPTPPETDEPAARPSQAPAWLEPQLRARFGDDYAAEARAWGERAPLDIRVNPTRASVAEVAAALDARPIAGLPLGLRTDMRAGLDRHPLYLAGGFEIQDAGSQMVTALAATRPGETVIDLCAGAGGKTLALAAAMAGEGRPNSTAGEGRPNSTTGEGRPNSTTGEGRLIASDTDRARLAAMAPRLARAGVTMVEPRLLNPQREAEALADLAGQADLVLVDAPCSGSGTWRRNPELRWRLTPERLARLVQTQARLIGLATPLLRPGGRILFVVCSVLDVEGAGHVPAAQALGLQLQHLHRLSPGHDATDGFQAASFTL